jgi:hypothetical protein
MSGMFRKKKIKNLHVQISICKGVLEAIFDECDKYDAQETGGRIIGYYKYEDETLNIQACGLIGSGPNARRSPVSFFQDGNHQEFIFRKIEAEHPDIEHLGNWHTHHVNGLDNLSSGDVDTYKKIVNHEKHNTDFFYALLIVAKNQSLFNRERYKVKHFLFKREESVFYEVPKSKVKIINKSPIFIDRDKANASAERTTPQVLYNDPTVNNIRSIDREIMSDVYSDLKPFFSRKAESLYWKGRLTLIDDTFVELLMSEFINRNKPSYSITLTGPSANRFKCRELYLNKSFDSALKAVLSFERDLNREIFKKKHFSSVE